MTAADLCRLDLRLLDDLTPARDLGLDVRRELSRRAAHRDHRLFHQLVGDLRRLGDRLNHLQGKQLVAENA